jgi:hypothetical protein
MDTQGGGNDRERKTIEDSFTTYDPGKLPYTRLCICDIIRDLPELSPDDIAKFQDK